MYRIFLFFALIPSAVFGQTPQDDYLTYMQAGGRRGTGIVIKVTDGENGPKATILTCFHVVLEDGGSGKVIVKYRSGISFVGKIVKWDFRNDLAIVEAPCPDGIKPCPIATKPPKGGDQLRLRGLGGDCDLVLGTIRDFEFSAGSAASGQRVVADIVVIGGDSGGAILLNGELVGVVSGGYETIDKGTFPSVAPSHWGLFAVGLDAIRRISADPPKPIIHP